MATTSIWSVKGWLGKLLIYAENPEKTLNPNFYPRKDLSEQERQGLDDVIDYAVQQGKTTKIDTDDENVSVIQRFVSGVNCSASTARDEMIAVKRRFGKENGVDAYHGYQSFAPGEVNPQTAHEIGLKLAQKLWGNGYQVIVATHLDQESHIHNHFVVNTVSFKDGKRYHRTEKDYYDKDSLNQTFAGKDSKEIGAELNSLENAIGAINHRMSRTLRESFKGAVSKDYER